MTGEPGPVDLSEEEAALVAGEARAAARVLDEARAAQALRLADAAGEGSVPAELVEALGEILRASLQGGRARRLYRAEGEGLLAQVLRRTPSGQQLQQGLDSVNGALGCLDGRLLQRVRVGMRTPGHFTVTFSSEGFSLTLAIRPDEVAVEGVAV